MSTIDAHVHLYPPDINRDPAGWAALHSEPRWADLCLRRRKNGRPVQSFPSVNELLRRMDEAEVGRAVLLGWYWEHQENCATQNRFYADCVRAHPDRLSAFATIQPAAGPDFAVAEIRRAHGEGLIGIGELSPHAQGYGAKSEEFRSVLSAAAELGLTVNLHVTDPATGTYPGRVETPWQDFVDLALTWPRVKFIFAHWGGGLAFGGTAEADRLRGCENVFYDTAASPLLYDAGAWGRGTAAAGSDRVLFGSDFPLNLYPRFEPEAEMKRFLVEARDAGLDDQELAAVLAENAKRLLIRSK